MARRKTHEEFVAELAEINPNIEVLGEYINKRTKIMCACKIDGWRWSSLPTCLLKGHGCAECAGTRRKTHKEFISELARINPKIEVLGKYKNSYTKILCKCKICGWEWRVAPNSLLSRKTGCRKCFDKANSLRYSKSQDVFIKEMSNINPNIEIIGQYVNNMTKIKCRCPEGHVWEPTPNNLLAGSGCVDCAGLRKKTHGEFIKELALLNPDIEVVSEYTGSNNKLKCVCNIDGHVWETTPNHLLEGKGCPKCSASKGEKQIAKYLKKHNIPYNYQHTFDDCRNIYPLVFDFYIPNMKTTIEYDGEQHFQPIDYFGGQEAFEDTKRRDWIKNKYCIDNNIYMIRIPYTVPEIEPFLMEALEVRRGWLYD